jgi:hypothetical protein
MKFRACAVQRRDNRGAGIRGVEESQLVGGDVSVGRERVVQEVDDVRRDAGFAGAAGIRKRDQTGSNIRERGVGGGAGVMKPNVAGVGDVCGAGAAGVVKINVATADVVDAGGASGA